KRTDDLFDEVKKALQASDLSGGKPDISFQEFLDKAGRNGLSTEARALALQFVQGFDAADPVRVSAQSIAEEWASGGMLDAPQSRPVGGYSAVLTALAGALDRKIAHVQLQTVVTRVGWRRGAVDVEGLFLGRPFRVSAPRVIVTVPVGVLQLPGGALGAIAFSPALAGKSRA